MQLNTGTPLIGKPSMGSWLTYGLGTQNDSLPAFVVMIDPRGGPIGSASNWSAGFMPAAYQGTLFRGQGSPLLDLATPPGVTPQQQRESLDVLKALNEEHRKARPADTELAAFYKVPARRGARRQRLGLVDRLTSHPGPGKWQQTVDDDEGPIATDYRLIVLTGALSTTRGRRGNGLRPLSTPAHHSLGNGRKSGSSLSGQSSTESISGNEFAAQI